jgi:hypothetical protein
MATEKKLVENQFILEVRYNPNPRILDRRGQWAEELLNHLNLTQWQINENRIDVYTEKKDLRAFVSFKSMGMIIYDSPSREHFGSLSSKFIEFVFRLKEFGSPMLIKRIGIRGTFCSPYGGEFNNLVQLYTKKFVKINARAVDAIGEDAEIIDIGSPVTFSDNNGKLSFTAGPMTGEQFPHFFERDKEFPKVGLFVDMDYWQEPDKNMRASEIISSVKKMSGILWDRHKRIDHLVFSQEEISIM